MALDCLSSNRSLARAFPKVSITLLYYRNPIICQACVSPVFPEKYIEDAVWRVCPSSPYRRSALTRWGGASQPPDPGPPKSPAETLACAPPYSDLEASGWSGKAPERVTQVPERKRPSTVSDRRLNECLTVWRRGWDSSRSLRELPANMPLRGCVGRTGFEALNPLGKNAKGPEWGLSHFGGEGGIRTHGTVQPYT